MLKRFIFTRNYKYNQKQERYREKKERNYIYKGKPQERKKYPMILEEPRKKRKESTLKRANKQEAPDNTQKNKYARFSKEENLSRWKSYTIDMR